MKSLLGVILIGLFIFSHAEVWGADWKLLGKDIHLDYFYDAESITRLSGNILRIWAKAEYTEKGIIEKMKINGPKYSNISFSMELYEFDCANKMARCLSLTHYYKNGTILASSTDGDFRISTVWYFIIPDSGDDLLSKAVCK